MGSMQNEKAQHANFSLYVCALTIIVHIMKVSTPAYKSVCQIYNWNNTIHYTNVYIAIPIHISLGNFTSDYFDKHTLKKQQQTNRPVYNIHIQ